MDFVAPQGQEGRAVSVATLSAVVKAGAEKNETAFLATAADPYIQHSPDLADGMKPVYDLLANRPEGFSSTQMKWLGEKGFLDNGNYVVMLWEMNRRGGTLPSEFSTSIILTKMGNMPSIGMIYGSPFQTKLRQGSQILAGQRVHGYSQAKLNGANFRDLYT